MKLYLKGHEYKYAVEQMISTLFPGEKPEYSGRPFSDSGMAVSLSKGEKYTTAVCRYYQNGEKHIGRSSAANVFFEGETERDSVSQRIIKTAVYRAVISSGMARPAWGALTGVRPGKLMLGTIRETEGKEEAVRRFMDEYDVSRERAELCYSTSLKTSEAARSLKEKDICLYVGIPFCPTRCAYCSFVSQSVEKSMKLIEPYLEALGQEIRALAEQIRKSGLNPVSVYFGGGTPTTLSASQLDALCTLLEKEIDLSHLTEYTVEAGRPDTITEEKLLVLKKHGVTRVSVNPQTMEDAVLEAIGRKHTAADVLSALEKVRKVGGFDVNMDLIAGLPKDTFEGFAETMRTVAALNPENITVHTLSLKRGSGITRNHTEIPSPAEVSQMLEYAYSLLKTNGFEPYYLYRQKNMSGGFENTGWARDGKTNLYNICMMEEICGILSAGGGGSTKLIKSGGGKNLRITAPKYPLEYIENIRKTCEEKSKIGEFYDV